MTKDVTAEDASEGVIFEFIVVGNSQKVSAIDVASGVEVSIIAPVNADQSYVQQIALRKLERRLQKDKKKFGKDGFII